MSLESLQYIDNHRPHRYVFCIECKPTNRICQLYNRQVKIMIINGGTNILVGGAFLKCFSIFRTCTRYRYGVCLAMASNEIDSFESNTY